MSAPFGAWGEPAFIGIHGPQGVGKSTDATLAFVDGWTLSLPGALKGVMPILGPDWYAYVMARRVEVTCLEHVVQVLDQIIDGTRAPLPCRVDDITLLADATLGMLDDSYPSTGGGVFAKWAHFGRIIRELKRKMRLARVFVVAGGHTAEPKTDQQGRYHMGGLSVSAPSAIPKLAAEMDEVWRLMTAPNRVPWPTAYHCEIPNHEWIYKSRHHVINGVAPANMRELLMAAGFPMLRPEGLSWMDGYADTVAADARCIGDQVGAHAVLTEHVAHLIAQGVFEGHAYWCVRDGMDRAQIRATNSPISRILARAQHHEEPAVVGIIQPPPATT